MFLRLGLLKVNDVIKLYQLELDFESATHTYFKRKYHRFSHINKLIPISRVPQDAEGAPPRHGTPRHRHGTATAEKEEQNLLW